MIKQHNKLKLLPYNSYQGVNKSDPIRFYYWPIIGSLYRQRVEICLEECNGGERVLEVGFGTGLCFLNLNEMYKEIYGIDLDVNIDSISKLFFNLGVNPHLKNGNVLQLPYPDGYFDTILLVSILEHLKNYEQIDAFHEIFRVLKPGGQVVFGVPVERSLMVAIFRTMGVDIRKHHFSTHEDVLQAAKLVFSGKSRNKIRFLEKFLIGKLYQVGNFVKPIPNVDSIE